MLLAAASGVFAATTSQRVVALVEEAARQQLARQVEREAWAEAQLELAVLPGKPVPACAGDVSVEALETRQATRMRFLARCEGAEAWRHEFIVRAGISAQVVVASKTLPAGRVLDTADLALERRNVSATPDAFSDIEAAAGLAPKRALRSGEPLRKSQLAAPVLVKRGDVVRIVAQRGPVEVSAAGEALEPGAQGDIVRVRNSNTGKLLRARVVEAGRVEPVDMP